MTADTVGGVWTYALDLSRELSRLGVEVHVATMGAGLTRQQQSDVEAIRGLRIHESNFRLEWMDNPWADVEQAAAWLLTLENEIAPDVVHLNGYAHGDLPWRAPHLVVGHSCVLSWWRSVKREEAPAAYDRYREAVTRGLQAADCVVTPSRSMLGELQRYYGPLRWSAVVPNGRDRLAFHPGAKEPIILSAGRVWDEAKNLGALSDIRARVDWPIYVAGDTRHPEGGSRGLPNVEMLGVLGPEELAGWMSRAAIYCLPARYEPFGLSVLEAALSGCALVLGDIPSLRENWAGAAAFVPPCDPGALIRELQDLTANSARRRALAATALSRARAFTPQRMVEAYLGLYAEIFEADVTSALHRE